VSLPLIVNPDAEEDLAEARAYLEEQREGLGDKFLSRVEEAFSRISQMPEAHAKIFQELRRALVRQFQYAIFYRVDDDQVTVVAVYHTRRDPRGWQSRA
jgi:plasmid stabilization system protein ParE